MRECLLFEVTIMLNKERLIDEFIELVSVPCASKDEKQEAELIMSKLRAMGIEPEMDNVHEKTGGTCGNVWAYVKGNVPTAPVLFFEAHMDSVAPTTGTSFFMHIVHFRLNAHRTQFAHNKFCFLFFIFTGTGNAYQLDKFVY